MTLSAEAKAAEMAVVLALAPLLDKYGRRAVGEVLSRISETLLRAELAESVDVKARRK